MNKPHNNVVERLFSSKIGEQDWITVLDEWDQEGKLDWFWTEDNKDPLLFKWVASDQKIPEFCIESLTQKHGSAFWTTQVNHVSALSKIMYSCPNHFGHAAFKTMAQHVVKNVDGDQVDRLIVKRPSQADLWKLPADFWEGPLLSIAYLTQYSQFGAAAELLIKNPQLIKETHKGWNAAALMCQSGTGWSHYMRAGGSLFDPVYMHPHSGEELKEGVPLWLWLIKKKLYHDQLKETLSSLLDRANNNRTPADGELVVSEEEWQKVLSKKQMIASQMAMIQFEKDIEKDWRKATKGNKLWRKWRSNDGANFIKWIAINATTEFVRQTHKIKLNHAQMKEVDDMGNDILSYFFMGIFNHDFGGWRRREKFLKNHWPEAVKNIFEQGNANPEKGLLTQWVLSEDTAFFGKAKKLSEYLPSHYGNNNHVWDALLPHPKLLWNGFDDANVFNKMFLSQNTVKRVDGFLNGCFHLAWNNADHRTMFNNMSTEAKIVVLGVVGNGENFYRMNSEQKKFFEEEFSKVVQQSNTLNHLVFDGAVQWMKSKKGYSRSEISEQVQAWFEQQSLSKQLLPQEHEVMDQPATPQRKRRM